MNFYQIFLPVSTILYILLAFVLRSFILWKQTGVNAFVFRNTDNAHDYIGSAFKGIALTTFASIFIYSFLPGYYTYLGPIDYLEIDLLKVSGVILLILSFTWTIIAQYQMSRSWRIGIDYGEKTKLISHGLFLFSRNPIFLGVIVTYLGTFLIIPNAISFSMLLITYVVIQIQVRLEEEYLQSIQGKEYLTYKARVRRWL